MHSLLPSFPNNEINSDGRWKRRWRRRSNTKCWLTRWRCIVWNVGGRSVNPSSLCWQEETLNWPSVNWWMISALLCTATPSLSEWTWASVSGSVWRHSNNHNNEKKSKQKQTHLVIIIWLFFYIEWVTYRRFPSISKNRFGEWRQTTHNGPQRPRTNQPKHQTTHQRRSPSPFRRLFATGRRVLFWWPPLVHPTTPTVNFNRSHPVSSNLTHPIPS